MLIQVMLCFLGKVEGVSRGIAVLIKDIRHLRRDRIPKCFVYLTYRSTNLKEMSTSLKHKKSSLVTSARELSENMYFSDLTSHLTLVVCSCIKYYKAILETLLAYPYYAVLFPDPKPTLVKSRLFKNRELY